ncbi:MAG: (2Fe-2S)-binding protein [Burkholderiales bacterium]|nr:(2Fe-2S)-binding protein [Burkholderiales bacterium]
MTETIKLNVNGVEHSVTAEADTPLIYILRNDLNLMGTRFGCGLGQCGACNVLIDGNNVASCDTPLWAAAGKRTTTIEGLGTPDHLHPLQQAFVDEQAAQCGYCVNGIIISAKALLDRNPEPGEDEIRAALDRNLCRCGTHNRFIRAIQRMVREAKGNVAR